MQRILILWLVSLLPSAAWALARPNGLISDNAVLQQGIAVPIWGTGDDGERVTVRFQDQSVATTVRDGKWMVRLKPLKAGGPFTMMVVGDNALEIRNILVGEVWICSGQSNMQWPISASAYPEDVIAKSSDPMLRLFTVSRQASDEPKRDVKGTWQESAAETVPSFSAVAYHFGKELRKALGVPVGLISTNVGGTPAEAWTSRPVLEANADFRIALDNHARALANYPAALERHRAALEEHKRAIERAKAEGKEPPRAPTPPPNPTTSMQRPSGLYNAMIAPLVPYPIRGAIWYQGESNAGRAYQYRTLFPAMIRNWRDAWGQGDFPFLFVQLAPFMKIVDEPQESAWAELREAQLLTSLNFPKTGMAVITDAGDETDIHPKDKQTVSKRLALAARALVYSEPIVYSGPVYRSMKVRGERIVLSFNHIGGGLMAKGEELKGFAIAGEDRKFINAKAQIRGDKVMVWRPEISKPVAVRYGWMNFPTGNLYNEDGLPASPFRTDDFPMVTKPN